MALLSNPNQVETDRYKLLDRFDSSYWAGTDLEIQVRSSEGEDWVLLQRAIQVTYQLLEQVIPLFGYASWVADRFHHGSRIITGELSLTLARYGEFLALIDLLTTGKGSARNPDPQQPATMGPTTPAFNTILGDGSGAGAIGAVIAASIGDLFGLSAPQASMLAATWKNSVTAQQAAADPFSNLATPKIDRNGPIYSIHPKIGFDMRIVLGGSQDVPKALKYVGSNAYSLTQPVTQPLDEYRAATGIILHGVNLGSSSMMLDDSGRALIETYSFMANDISIVSYEDLRGKAK
jgi:hypothetical protein